MTEAVPPARADVFRIYPMVVVSAAIFAGFFARDAFRPMQETVRVAMALTDGHLALLQGPAVALSISAGLIPLGLLIDRVSRTRLLTLSVLCSAIAMGVISMAPGFAALFAGRFMLGIASIAPLVIAVSIVPDLYPAAQRGRAFGILGIFDNAGSAVATVLGGWLLVALGQPADSWRWATIAMAAPVSLIALLPLFLAEPPRTEELRARPSLAASAVELWKLRAAAGPLLAGRILVGVGNVAALEWATPLMGRRFGLAPDATGSIIAAIVVIAGLASSLFGALAADLGERFGGPRLTMLVLGILSILMGAAGLFALAPDPFAASLGLGAFLVLGYTVSVAALALSTLVVPNELRGFYTSVTLAIGNLCAVALAPVLVTTCARLFGGTEALALALAGVCGMAAVAAALSFLGGSRLLPFRHKDASQ